VGERGTIREVQGEWLIPRDATEDPVILYMHGGGIVFGWSNPTRRILGHLAKFSGLRAFGVDYRLVPKHRYPAAHDDCFMAYRELVKCGIKVVLVGESSGGVLALATLLRAKEARIPQPELCVLLAPVVDYGFHDERIWDYTDALLHPKFTVEIHKHYIDENDTMLPDLAPVYADLSGLAPLYILAGERELLRGEVDRLEEAALKYDLEVEKHLWPDVWHGWHVLAPQLPEGTAALKLLGEVIRERTKP
jgi:acetyl esterase/lipase